MAFAELSDEQLVAECRRRKGPERDAFIDELFSRHYQRVARWCYRMTDNREAAADLAQDVFLKAHRRLDSFKGTARFSTWLYSIVRNESLNLMKKTVPIVHDEEVLTEIAAIEAGPDQVAEQNQRASRLQRFLSATLDPVERTVFTLHYGDDMPLDTITRMLDLGNASGAKAYIVSARRKLARAAQRVLARGEEL